MDNNKKNQWVVINPADARMVWSVGVKGFGNGAWTRDPERAKLYKRPHNAQKRADSIRSDKSEIALFSHWLEYSAAPLNRQTAPKQTPQIDALPGMAPLGMACPKPSSAPYCYSSKAKAPKSFGGALLAMAKGDDGASPMVFLAKQAEAKKDKRDKSQARRAAWDKRPEAVKPSNNAPRIFEHVHTKKGTRLYIATIGAKLERSAFVLLREAAKSAGGYYSRAWGKVPGGFAFKSREAAEAFSASRMVCPKPQSAPQADGAWLADMVDKFGHGPI